MTAHIVHDPDRGRVVHDLLRVIREEDILREVVPAVVPIHVLKHEARAGHLLRPLNHLRVEVRRREDPGLGFRIENLAVEGGVVVLAVSVAARGTERKMRGRSERRVRTYGSALRR